MQQSSSPSCSAGPPVYPPQYPLPPGAPTGTSYPPPQGGPMPPGSYPPSLIQYPPVQIPGSYPPPPGVYYPPPQGGPMPPAGSYPPPPPVAVGIPVYPPQQQLVGNAWQQGGYQQQVVVMPAGVPMHALEDPSGFPLACIFSSMCGLCGIMGYLCHQTQYYMSGFLTGFGIQALVVVDTS